MIPFVKMHGIGNDFVIVDRVTHPELDLDFSSASVQLCDRHFGIGGDGVILVEKTEGDTFEMRMFNPDGSESEMCGNGLRCFGQYLLDSSKAQIGEFPVKTGAGELRVNVLGEGKTSIDMGEAILAPVKIGMRWMTGDNFVHQPIGGGYYGTAVSMGNPHLVIFVDDVASVDLAHLGKELETHPYFPNRVNVHFAQVIDSGHLIQRTWERGAGITLACGTGACACGVAAFLEGKADRAVEIQLPGGILNIEHKETGHVTMTGSATTVFSGQFNLL